MLIEESSVSRETDFIIPKPKTTRRIVISNQKGGVGKTTSAVNLAAALALGGMKVVLIDVDPQGNASTALGVSHETGVTGTYDVIIEKVPLADVLKKSTEYGDLKVVPATQDLAGAEIALATMMARETRLKRAIDEYLENHEADYILFDCPPSLGLLTINAMVAAKEVLIPIQAEYYALEGVIQLHRTIQVVREEMNPQLRLSGVLLTMYDARTNLSGQVFNELKNYFPNEMLKTVVARSVRLSEAPSYQQTIFSYDPRSVGATSYKKAALELATREELA